MRRVSTPFKALSYRGHVGRCGGALGGVRRGRATALPRSTCPWETHLGHCHSAGEALRLLPGRLDTRATRGPARRVRGGACAACHPPASLGVASALRAIPLAPAAVDRARAPRERPDLVQICPAGPLRETVFFLCGAAIVAAVINPAPNLSLTFPLPPRPPSFRSSTARSSCLSRACWSSRRR